MYYAVEVRGGNNIYAVDPQRIFRTSDAAHKSVLKGEDAVVTLLNASQLLLALIHRGIDVDTANGIIRSL